MNDITRTYGDTRRIGMRISDGFEPITLAGWVSFKLVVAASPAALEADELMSVDGIVVDSSEGRIAFTPLGTVPVGNYYYNARAVDGNGEVVTLKKGRYLVPSRIE